MITEFGKAIRKIRIDTDQRLADMAKLIGKSPAFISAIERGEKSPPPGFEEDIVSAYQLDWEAANLLRNLADASRETFTVKPTSNLEREAAGLMARRMGSGFDALSQQELERIVSILKKQEDG